MTPRITIVGGGVAGLVAAIAGRESGLDVRLVEARNELGGRARSVRGDYRANWGPHVLYGSTDIWKWLDDRSLAKPANRPSYTSPVRFRCRDRFRRTPPPAVVRAAWRLRGREAPSDKSFLEWGSEELGNEQVVRHVAALAGGLLFAYEPWQLSAAFVLAKLKILTAVPPTARYVVGGWGSLVGRLEARARELGVQITLETRVVAVPEPPVIVATPLETAARLLGEPSLRWPGTTVASLDVGLRAARGDSYLVFDLDHAGFAVGSSFPDSTVAPAGEHLVQAQVAMRPGEELSAAIGRVEELLDGGYRGWRERLTWRRQLKLVEQTGAIDKPGVSWRDRPAVDRGDGVYVASDKSAAPGLLGEVSFNAALAAVDSIAANYSVAPSHPVTKHDA